MLDGAAATQLHGQHLSLLTVQTLQQKLITSDVPKLHTKNKKKQAYLKVLGHDNQFITAANCERNSVGSVVVI